MIDCLQSRGFFAVHNRETAKGFVAGIVFVSETCLQQTPFFIINPKTNQTYQIKPIPVGCHTNQEIELWDC